MNLINYTRFHKFTDNNQRYHSTLCISVCKIILMQNLHSSYKDYIIERLRYSKRLVTKMMINVCINITEEAWYSYPFKGELIKVARSSYVRVNKNANAFRTTISSVQHNTYFLSSSIKLSQSRCTMKEKWNKLRISESIIKYNNQN